MSKILLIEDEKELAAVVVDWLSDERYVVETAYDGQIGSDMLKAARYDLVILDLMLPFKNGLEICKEYRDSGGDAPIMMLTAKKSLTSKEEGLDSGADDYLTKPFKLRELSARIRALLRRPRVVLPKLLTAGDITVDSAARRVTVKDEEIRLLVKEYGLLEILLRNRGQVLSVDTLIDSVWNNESTISSDTIRSYIRSLRRKIKDESGSIVQNIHGSGYKID